MKKPSDKDGDKARGAAGTMPTKPKTKAKAQAKKAKPKAAAKPKPTAEQIANRANKKTNLLTDRMDNHSQRLSEHREAIAGLRHNLDLLNGKYSKLDTEYNKLVTEHNKLIDQYAGIKETMVSNSKYAVSQYRKFEELEKLVEKLRTSPRSNHATAKELADLHGIVTEHAEQTRKVIEAVQQQVQNVVDVRNSVGGGI